MSKQKTEKDQAIFKVPSEVWDKINYYLKDKDFFSLATTHSGFFKKPNFTKRLNQITQHYNIVNNHKNDYLTNFNKVYEHPTIAVLFFNDYHLIAHKKGIVFFPISDLKASYELVKLSEESELLNMEKLTREGKTYLICHIQKTQLENTNLRDYLYILDPKTGKELLPCIQLKEGEAHNILVHNNSIYQFSSSNCTFLRLLDHYYTNFKKPALTSAPPEEFLGSNYSIALSRMDMSGNYLSGPIVFNKVEGGVKGKEMLLIEEMGNSFNVSCVYIQNVLKLGLLGLENAKRENILKVKNLSNSNVKDYTLQITCDFFQKRTPFDPVFFTTNQACLKIFLKNDQINTQEIGSLPKNHILDGIAPVIHYLTPLDKGLGAVAFSGDLDGNVFAKSFLPELDGQDYLIISCKQNSSIPRSCLKNKMLVCYATQEKIHSVELDFPSISHFAFDPRNGCLYVTGPNTEGLNKNYNLHCISWNSIKSDKAEEVQNETDSNKIKFLMQ